MSRFRIIPALILTIALAANVGYAQGKGQDKGKGNDKKDHAAKADHRSSKQDHAKSKGPSKSKAGNKDHKADGKVAHNTKSSFKKNGSFKRAVSTRDLQPSVIRYVRSTRAPERVAAGALAYAFARGIDNTALIIDNSSDRVRVKNRSGVVLVDLDDDRARNLGAWDVRPYRDDDVKSDGPAFCRSGVGHPVWGRQWCVDKGFGLGRNDEIRWGRTTNSLSDIVFVRPAVDKETLLRDALIATVGNVVLDRLGLHALTMGYTEPVTGYWVAQPTGARVLMLNSGTYPVAEVVDLDRDNRADMMLVALRPW